MAVYSSIISEKQKAKQNRIYQDILRGNACIREKPRSTHMLKSLADRDTGLILAAGEREEGSDGVTDVRPERCLECGLNSNVAHSEVGFFGFLSRKSNPLNQGNQGESSEKEPVLSEVLGRASSLGLRRCFLGEAVAEF